MQQLFDYLNVIGLKGKSLHKILFKLKDSDIIQILEIINNIIQENSDIKSDSKFSFVANSTLSGEPRPCASYSCRLNNIDTLARNSILYADTVYVTNPFEKYYHCISFTDFDKLRLEYDLLLLYHVKSLFLEGIFRFSSTFTHVCRDCLRKEKILTKAYEGKLNKAEKYLTEKILADFKYIIEFDEYDKPSIEVYGTNDIIDHPLVFNYNEKYPERFNALKSNRKSKKLSRNEIIDLDLVSDFTYPIVNDLMVQNYYTNIYKAHYLTNRKIDGLLIQNNQDKNKLAISEHISQSLNHKIPFLPTADLSKLLKLRKHEGEAFQLYRNSLTQFLSTIKSTEYNLKEAFQDEIQPELLKISQTIKKTKKTIFQDFSKDVIVGSTFVSVGLFTNFLPQTVGTVITALGGINYVDKIGNSIKKMATIENEVKDNKYYFIWKMLRQ